MDSGKISEPQKKSLIVDANILIDYFESDPSILLLASNHIGQIHVASPNFVEAKKVTIEHLKSCKIKIVDPTLEQLIKAEANKGRLSFQDLICFYLGKENGWTCVTNDSRLRRECEQEDVEVYWGLELMVLLVEAGRLNKKDAIDVATQIHENNPRFIGVKVVEEFKKRVSFFK